MFLNSSHWQVLIIYLFSHFVMWAAPIDHERRNCFVFTPHRGSVWGWLRPNCGLGHAPTMIGQSMGLPVCGRRYWRVPVVFHLSISLYYVCVCVCVPSFSVPALQSANRPPHLPVCLLTHLLLTSSSSCLALLPPPVSAPHYTHLVRPTRPPPPSVGSVLMRLMTT